MPKHVRENTSETSIVYPDGSNLSRPFDLPRSKYIIAGVFVLVAAIIGFFIIQNVLDKVIFSAERQQATVQEIIATEKPLAFPYLLTSMNQTDDEIRAWMTESGFTTYDLATDADGNPVAFDVVKLPEDVSLLEAQLIYAQGLASASAEDVARLLHGSWQFVIDRSDPLSMVVYYADFTSGSIDAAVQNALVAESLDTSELSDSGVDSVGNTFKEGTVTHPETEQTFQWRVSAIPLSDKYNVNGLPEDAVYVGIRMSI